MSFKEIGEAVKMVSMTVKTWTEDFQVKICQQEIVRLDLLVQSLIRVTSVFKYLFGRFFTYTPLSPTLKQTSATSV